MATYFALVTFDLHDTHKKSNAKAIYADVRSRLEKLNLQKTVFSPDRECDIELPRNTFVGRFPVEDKFRTSKQLRKYLSEETRDILRDVYPNATVFVLVGRGWSWGRRDVKPKKKSAL